MFAVDSDESINAILIKMMNKVYKTDFTEVNEDFIKALIDTKEYLDIKEKIRYFSYEIQDYLNRNPCRALLYSNYETMPNTCNILPICTIGHVKTKYENAILCANKMITGIVNWLDSNKSVEDYAYNFSNDKEFVTYAIPGVQALLNSLEYNKSQNIKFIIYAIYQFANFLGWKGIVYIIDNNKLYNNLLFTEKYKDIVNDRFGPTFNVGEIVPDRIDEIENKYVNSKKFTYYDYIDIFNYYIIKGDKEALSKFILQKEFSIFDFMGDKDNLPKSTTVNDKLLLSTAMYRTLTYACDDTDKLFNIVNSKYSTNDEVLQYFVENEYSDKVKFGSDYYTDECTNASSRRCVYKRLIKDYDN